MIRRRTLLADDGRGRGRYENYFTNPIIGVELLGTAAPEEVRW